MKIDDNITIWYLFNNRHRDLPINLKGFNNKGKIIYEYPIKKGFTNDELVNKQWYISFINFENKVKKEGKQLVVALVDSGVNKHQELEGQLLQGYDFVEDDTHPNDDLIHGTKMAGIIAAKTNNAIGIAGINPYVKILPIKVINDNVSKVEDIVKGINFAIDNKVDIINISVGTIIDNPELKEVILKAKKFDIPIVAAVGNDGQNSIMYPARYSYVISVGAVDQYYNKAHFSNYEDIIDIYAPGVNILSLGPKNGYVFSSGTSHAASIVTALISLVISEHPKISVAEIKQLLKKSCYKPKNWGFYGSGIIDANKLIELSNNY